MFTYASDIRLT